MPSNPSRIRTLFLRNAHVLSAGKFEVLAVQSREVQSSISNVDARVAVGIVGRVAEYEELDGDVGLVGEGMGAVYVGLLDDVGCAFSGGVGVKAFLWDEW